MYIVSLLMDMKIYLNYILKNRMIEGVTEIEGRTSAVINITGFLPRKYTEKDVKKQSTTYCV